MNLKRERILDVLIDILKKIQQDIVEKPERINEETVPIGDLYNFDSLTSVEVTIEVLDALGFREFPSCPSLFINKKQMALTVGQVADIILKLNQERV